jgi:hypothetical protein
MDFFNEEKRKERNLRKSGEKLASSISTPEARQKAIDFLAAEGTEEAISMLLQRFKSRITSQIADREEKEHVLSLVVGFGPKALGPIREYLRREDEIRFPLMALAELAGDEECVETVCGLLNEMGIPLPRQRGKAMHLLRFLEDYRDARVPAAVLPLLQDDGVDDDLRVAAASVLGRQEESDVARVALLEALVSEEESIRLKNAVIEILADAEWGVQGYRKKIEALLPEGHVIDRAGFIRRRGMGTD